MGISKIIVSGYKRLFLNNIKYFELTPKSNTQIILGTNGSGKSSLLRVTNPLPDDKHAYEEGGYKEYHRTHNGQDYVLTFNKLAPGKYSFRVGNQELNMSGTKRAQLHLVEEHFNLTPKSNEVILGSAKLTNMSPIDRRYWFRHMSNTDYSFSIKLYNDLKSRLRDVKGAIKIISNEIVMDTSNKLLKDEELERYLKNRDMLKDLITKVSYKYNSKEIVIPSVDIFKEIDSETTKVERLIEKGATLDSVHDLEVEIAKHLTKKEILDKTIDDINNTLDKMENIIDTTDIDKKKLELTYRLEDIEVLKENVTLDVKYEDLENINKTFKLIHNDVLSYVLELESYSAIDLSVKDEQTALRALRALEGAVGKIGSEVKSLEVEYETLTANKNEDNKITCNKCGDVSYFGYDEGRVKTLKERIEEKKPVFESKTVELKKLSEEYSKIHTKTEILTSLETLLIKSNLTMLLVELNKDKDYYHRTDKELLNFFNKMLVDLDKWSVITERISKIKELEYDIKLMEEADLIKKKHMVESKNSLEDKLADAITDRKIINITLLDIEKRIESRKVLMTSVDRLKKLLRYSSRLRILKTRKMEQELNIQLISNLKEELYHLEETISDNNRVKDKISNNEKSLEEYTKIAEVLQVTLDALSPNGGLIAKSIMSFINLILSDMNNIINSVWSYNIELLPCQIDDDNDLDYKFRVKVDNKPDTVDDVSNLSSSMQEMVDLAFKIVFMKYSKLTHMPLFLDEFGITMDSKHRHAVYNVLDNILSLNFDQLFITAHYKSMYGRFTNADITVLDARNIELNSEVKFNKRVVIS